MQCAAALAMEVLLNPGVLVANDFIERPADHLPIDDHADPVADPEDGIEIVRDHHHRQRQPFLQLQYRTLKGSQC